MGAPTWDDLKLIEMTPSGAFFAGEHAGSPASIVRLSEAARDRVRSRLSRLEGVPARRVLGSGLDEDPPWIALELPAVTLDAHPLSSGSEALAIVGDVASALALAHGLGLSHGGLSLPAIGLDAAGRASVSLLGLDTPAGSRPSDDALALGAVIRALVLALETDQRERESLLPWAERLSEPDPARRPSVSALSRALRNEAPPAVDLHDEVAIEDAGSIDAHPPAPSSERAAVQRRFEWRLRASPEVLWPFVANTERVNRALGLAPMEQNILVDPASGEPVIWGRSSQVGFELKWRERPYEWVAGHRLGVVREYATGPIRWLKSTIALLPGEEGGTHLVQILEAEPRNVLARAVVAIELGVRMKRALDRVYTRIDEVLAGGFEPKGRIEPDAFEPVEALDRGVAALIDEKETWILARHPEASEAISALADALRFSPSPELSRIQPVALARKLGVDEEQMITACLAATSGGMLVAGWDLLCPSCRAPSGFAETMRSLTEHGRCEVCAMDFDLDLTSSIELVFQPHASIRSADEATYCLSSPAHAPHVVAQVILGAGERIALPPLLTPGAWLIARRGAPPIALDVRAGLTRRVEIPLSATATRFTSGRTVLVVNNDTPSPARVRVEASARRADVLTAARAVTHPLFEKVFPGDTLAPGVCVTASTMTFVATAREDGDEAPAVLGYDDPVRALAIALTQAHDRRRVSMELGAAVATSSEGRVVYEGEPLSRARENLERARPRDIVMGPRLASTVEIVDLAHQLETEGALSLVGAAGPTGIRYRAS